MKSKITRFESAGEFLEFIKSHKPLQSWADKADLYGGMPFDSRSDPSNHDWTLGLDFPQALKTAENGWADGLKKISQAVTLYPKSVRRRWENAHAGAFADVPAFLSGVPESMKTRKSYQSTKAPIIDILISRAMLANVLGGCFLNYGIAIAELIDSLESEGFSVNLDSAAICTVRGHLGDITNLKKPGESLDLGKLIFFVAHPACHRRLSFYFRTLQTEYNDFVGMDMGSTIKISNLRQYAAPDQIIIGFDHDGLNSMRTPDIARKMVKAMLKSARPELLEEVA